MTAKVLAALTFLITYSFLITRRGRPAVVVWTAAGVLVILQVVTPVQAARSVNLNVIGILLGTMVLSGFFIRSKVPEHLACKLVTPKHSIGGAVLSVCVLSGVISAVVDNVATVLMVAPIALEIARRLKVSPVPFIIGISVSANLQGAATMVGDSTSILLASAAKMSFADFFWMDGRPGIFFSVQLAAVASFCLLYMSFRKFQGKSVEVRPAAVTSWVPATLLAMMVVTMAASSFIADRPPWAVGAIALVYAIAALVWNSVTGYQEFCVASDIDWQLAALLCGLFVLIGSLTTTGLVDDIAGLISSLAKGNAFLAYSIVVWVSVLVSAFVDNIPYTMAMLPVAQLISASTGVSPHVMMFGLLLGTTLGGNITPIGASANVVAVSLLRKNGESVSFAEFARIGVPFTVIAVVIGSLFNWIIWR